MGEANSRVVKRTENRLDVGLAGAWGPASNPRDLSHRAINGMFFEGACADQTGPAQASVNGIAAALGLPPGRALSSVATGIRYTVGS